MQNSKLGEIDALAPLIETTKARPKILDGTHAGDCGFDPAGFCKDDELLYFYLESEVIGGSSWMNRIWFCLDSTLDVHTWSFSLLLLLMDPPC